VAAAVGVAVEWLLSDGQVVVEWQSRWQWRSSDGGGHVVVADKLSRELNRKVTANKHSLEL
jgi:hypothetical protein